MSDTTFTNGVTLTDADWFNDVNRVVYTLLGDPATLIALRQTVGETLATLQTASGTGVDFSSIPSGVRRITISFAAVSTNGTNVFLIQIGDSGGLETTGYTGGGADIVGGAAAAQTVGFGVGTGLTAARSHSGTVTLTLADAATNLWTCTGTISRDSDGQTYLTSGSKALSATLDRVRIQMAGGVDAFDAGSLGLSYSY